MTHVRKTRSVTEPYTDASGKPAVRTRNETYWDETSVDLVGSVRAEFDVTYSRWDASEYLNVMEGIGGQEFLRGMKRVAKTSRQRRAGLEQRAEQLTAAIRSEIEARLEAHPES